MKSVEAVNLADAIEGTDAEGVLCGRKYRSFCAGSDALVAAGLTDEDGQVSNLGMEVRELLNYRASFSA